MTDPNASPFPFRLLRAISRNQTGPGVASTV